MVAHKQPIFTPDPRRVFWLKFGLRLLVTAGAQAWFVYTVIREGQGDLWQSAGLACVMAAMAHFYLASVRGSPRNMRRRVIWSVMIAVLSSLLALVAYFVGVVIMIHGGDPAGLAL